MPTELGCRSCLHSIGSADGGLWCGYFSRPARFVCSLLVYEPGTDA